MEKLVEVLVGREPRASQYRRLDPKRYRALQTLAKHLEGKVILHVNAAPVGGGVVELLKAQVPSERSFGIESHWLTIRAPSRFFGITKKIHNLLQGGRGTLSESEKSFYLSINHLLGKSLVKFCQRWGPTLVVIHDPQPLPLVQAIQPPTVSLLRFHLDLSGPDPLTLEFLRPLVMRYPSVVVSSPGYRKALPWLSRSRLQVVMPAIDPFSEKNRPMEGEIARQILSQFEINTVKPIVSQVSRFDRWKDPLGVIRAYYLAKNEIPELQLILVGFLKAQDDPEAVSVFERVKKHARGDPDILLFARPQALKHISHDHFINAVYTASTVIVQKSLQEGFGLTITEAMWKGRPVIAGANAGAALQIVHGKNGFIVNSPEEAAQAMVRLLRDSRLRQKVGKAAHASVKKHFLFPRYMLDTFKTYHTLIR